MTVVTTIIRTSTITKDFKSLLLKKREGGRKGGREGERERERGRLKISFNILYITYRLFPNQISYI